MGKAFGIAALIVAGLSVFVPIPLSYLGIWLALALATVATLSGERLFAVVAFLVTLVNLVAFSPLTFAALFVPDGEGGWNFLAVLTIVLFIGPIAGAILNATGRVTLDKAQDGPKVET